MNNEQKLSGQHASRCLDVRWVWSVLVPEVCDESKRICDMKFEIVRRYHNQVCKALTRWPSWDSTGGTYVRLFVQKYDNPNT